MKTPAVITPAVKADLLKQAKKLADDVEDAKIAAKCADRVEEIVKRACEKVRDAALAEKPEPEPVVRAGITDEARDRRLSVAARRAQVNRTSIQAELEALDAEDLAREAAIDRQVVAEHQAEDDYQKARNVARQKHA